MAAFGDAWGLCGGPLRILKRWIDGFFLDRGPGMGNEGQKCDLRVRLAVFQIMKTREFGDYLRLISSIFGTL